MAGRVSAARYRLIWPAATGRPEAIHSCRVGWSVRSHRLADTPDISLTCRKVVCGLSPWLCRAENTFAGQSLPAEESGTRPASPAGRLRETAIDLAGQLARSGPPAPP